MIYHPIETFTKALLDKMLNAGYLSFEFDDTLRVILITSLRDPKSDFILSSVAHMLNRILFKARLLYMATYQHLINWRTS